MNEHFFVSVKKDFGQLVQIRARSRMYTNSGRLAEPRASEQKLQRKLNQPRICPSGGCRYDAEILIVGGTAHGVGGGELSSVKQVEELGAQLQAEPFVARKPCSLEYRKVEIRYSRSPKARVHAWLIAEFKIGRRAEARSIEPSCKPGIKTCRNIRIAVWNNVGPRTSAEKRGSIHLTVRKNQREASLENSHAVDSPSTDNLVRDSFGLPKGRSNT